MSPGKFLAPDPSLFVINIYLEPSTGDDVIIPGASYDDADATGG